MVKIKKESTLDFSNLFLEAEKRLGWSWNKCCDIFHRGEIICTPENPKFKNMYLEDVEYYREKAKKGDEEGMAYSLIFDIMEENKIEELKIITD